jgi:hypothetical protein
METQENKLQEQPLFHKEQHELDEQQLESVQGGTGLPKAGSFSDWEKLMNQMINPKKRTAWEARLPNYNTLPNKAPRIK